MTRRTDHGTHTVAEAEAFEHRRAMDDYDPDPPHTYEYAEDES